jgi:uncharacterized protein Yka (UPF0111/DUF47 family)
MTSLHSVLASLRDLVDTYEKTIGELKIYVQTSRVEDASLLVDDIKRLTERTESTIVELKDTIVNLEGQEDRLARFITTYYRTLIYISVPYLIELCQDLVQIMEKMGHSIEALELRGLINRYERFLSTLKSK